jgi:hypothetical protein
MLRTVLASRREARIGIISTAAQLAAAAEKSGEFAGVAQLVEQLIRNQ